MFNYSTEIKMKGNTPRELWVRLKSSAIVACWEGRIGTAVRLVCRCVRIFPGLKLEYSVSQIIPNGQENLAKKNFFFKVGNYLHITS